MPLLKSLLWAVAATAGVMTSALANDWSNLATISMTDPVTPKLANRYICYTDGRDIRCDSPSLYVSTGGLVGINTSNPNAELDVYGTVSATNFVGDGSGLTGISTQGDRITSGTAPIGVIVNSATSYISLTNGATTWGYFGSGANYLPNLGVGGGVPATAVLQVSGTVAVSGSDIILDAGKGLVSSVGARIASGPGGATFGAYAGATPGANIFQWFTSASTQVGTIRANGYLGIGTVAPGRLVDIKADYNQLRLTASNTLTDMSAFDGGAGNAAVFDVNPVPGNSTEGSTVRMFRNVSTTGGINLIVARGNGTSEANALISGNGHSYLGGYIGNVGVGAGKWTPVAKLDVNGTISASDAIQVSGSSLTCSSGLKGAIRYSNTSNTLEYCNSVTWVPTGNITDTSLTAFTVTKNAIQTGIAAGSVVTWEAATTNNGGAFNLSTERFTAPVSGYYYFNASLLTNNDNSTGDFQIYKNGSATGLRGYGSNNLTAFKPAVAQGVLYLSAGDYVDVRAYAGTQTAYGGTGSSTSTFSGFLLNGGATGGGGGTATPAGGAGDIQFNDGSNLAADTGQLFWDASNNRLGIGTSAPGYPLHVSASSGGSVAGFSTAASDVNTYISVRNGATNHTVGVDADNVAYDFTSGAYKIFTGGANERLRVASGGNVGISTQSPTATLQVSGSFIVSTSGQTTTPTLYVGTNGRVGVGTSNPFYDFSVNGNVYVGGAARTIFKDTNSYLNFLAGGADADNPFWRGIHFAVPATLTAGASQYFPRVGVYWNYDNTANPTNATFNYVAGNSGPISTSLLFGTLTGGNISFQTSNTERFRLTAGGSIGVGTINPAVSLSVIGEVQVSNSGALCTNGLKGAIRYSNTSNTLEYCNSVAWVPTGNITDTSLTAFTVKKDSVQSGVGVGAVVTWDTAITNNGGAFDLSTERFTAPVNGYYFLIASLLSGSDGTSADVKIYKNGVATGLRGHGTAGAASYNPSTAQGVLYLAAGDYVDVRSNQASQSFYGALGASVSTFSGFLLNAGATGSGGGGTATPAGGAGDIQFNDGSNLAADTGQLFWDATNNRLGIGTATPTFDLDVRGGGLINVSGSIAGLQFADRSVGTGASGLFRSGNKTFLWDNYAGGSYRVAVDNVSGNVGIGTQSPTATLQVAGSLIVSTSTQTTTPTLYVGANGNVGIGTSSPVGLFDVTSWNNGAYIFSTSYREHANGGGAMFRHARGTSQSPSVLQQSDLAGSLFFDGYDGATYQHTAAIDSFVDGVPGSGDMPGALRFWTTPDGSISPQTRMVIKSSGNVGIATTNPFAKLDVNGTISASDAIQVGTSSLTCNSGLKGAMRYSNTSSTIEYCNGGNWSSMGPSATTAFILKRMSAHQSSLSVGSVIALDTVVNSNNADADSSGNRIVLAPGYTYEIVAALRANGTPGSTLLDYQVYDVTNGVSIGHPGNAGVGAYSDTPAVAFVAPTVSTAYEIRVTGLAGTPQVISNGSKLYAVKLGGGSSSGGGATPAGSSNDVQYNSSGALAADTGNFTYNGGLLTAPTMTTGGMTVTGQVSATYVSSSVVQVGSSSLACNSGLKGAMRYSNTSSTLEYCNSTAWTSLGPSDTAPVSFFAHRNSVAQTVAMNTWTKLNLTTEAWDTNNNFDSTTNYRFTPTKAGKYLFVYNLFCTGSSCYSQIRKNGVSTQQNNSSDGDPFTTSIVLDMNGSTDYVEAFVNVVNGTSVQGSAGLTNFSGTLLSSQGGGSGGGGATPAGSAGDIQFNDGSNLAADTGQLFWDSTNNRLGVGTSSPLEPLHVGNVTDGGRLFVGEDGSNRRGLLIAVNKANELSGATYPPYARIAAYDYASTTSIPLAISPHPNAKVSIGKLNPQAVLDVAGTISASDAIQVSGSSLTCSAGLKGAMRYSNASSTIEYCQGTAWVSMGPSATDVPAFFAHKNGTNQTVATNNWVKLTWSGERFDTHNNFAGDKFTPTVAGKYIVTASAACLSSNGYCAMAIYKNGTMYAQNNNAMTGSNYTIAGISSVIVDMNGTTDYLEAYIYSSVATVLGGVTDSYFTGSLIASGNGLAGGGGATPSGSTGDIQFNNGTNLAADTGQLFWDATNNRLGIGTGSPAYPLDVNGVVQATNFVKTSDRRLKTNILQISSGLAVVEKLNPVTFNWKKDGSPSAGLIAQDVAKLIPTAVVSNSQGILSVDYEQTIPYLIRGMQELKAANDNLARENETLRGRLERVERLVGGAR